MKTAKQNLENLKRKLLVVFISNLYLQEALKQKIDLAEESKQIQEGFLKITRSKVKTGNARSFELDQVMAEYYSYFPRIRDLKRRLFNLKETIKADILMAGEDLDLSIDLLPKIKGMIFPDLVSQIKEASAHRPDFIISKLNLKGAQISKKLVLGEHLPSLVFQGQLGYVNSSLEDLYKEAGTADSFGFVLTIPIFSGLSSIYSRRSAAEKIFSAEKQHYQMRQNLKSELLNAKEDYDASLESIEYTRRWSVNAEKALGKAVKSYRVGLIDNTQIVQLQQSKERARAAYIDAKVGLILSVLKMNLNLGRKIF